MSTLSSIYISMTALSGFSKSLDTVSNNVANLNTPGFKADDLLLSDLRFGRQAFDNRGIAVDTAFGEGVFVVGQNKRFSQGEIRQTGVATNVAVDGSGFFVLRDGERTFYTRAGQFEFDGAEQLVDTATGAQVMALNESGRLEGINVEAFRTNPPKSTENITFSGNLSLGDDEHVISDVTVFDSAGSEIPLTFTFTNNAVAGSGRWTVNVTNEDDTEIASGEIQFTASGTPQDGFNTLEIPIGPQGGEASTTVILDFGEPGSFDGATSFSGGPDSTLTAGEVDGFGVGTLTQVVFREDGTLDLTYSNGQEEIGPRLALADFSDPQRLNRREGSLFEAGQDQEVLLGWAAEDRFGTIEPESVELANVELTREFADIIILQRGFQAASQVLNVSNEIIEQVYNSVSGRG